METLYFRERDLGLYRDSSVKYELEEKTFWQSGVSDEIRRACELCHNRSMRGDKIAAIHDKSLVINRDTWMGDKRKRSIRIDPAGRPQVRLTSQEGAWSAVEEQEGCQDPGGSIRDDAGFHPR
jgi:cytochrome c peroxidase